MVEGIPQPKQNVVAILSIFLLPSSFCLKDFGSKPIIRNPNDYLGKGIQVLFPKNKFYMEMNFSMNFFVTF
jgi:hypothetical protein